MLDDTKNRKLFLPLRYVGRFHIEVKLLAGERMIQIDDGFVLQLVSSSVTS
jgi:hypothetical protein